MSAGPGARPFKASYLQTHYGVIDSTGIEIRTAGMKRRRQGFETIAERLYQIGKDPHRQGV